jgi:nucleoside-diphosphate-sugar epimerase
MAMPPGCEPFFVQDLRLPLPSGLFVGVDAVVHLAARVHDVTYRSAMDVDAYLSCNVEPTVRLAKEAAQAGASVFVFASTIKVNGESTRSGRPFTANDAPAPQGAYAVSKWRAEQALFELARHGILRIVAVRPPLVYGPGVKGNFRSLLGLVMKRVPLPLASIANARSLIYVENLAEVMARSLVTACPAVILPTDGALSTPQLIRDLGEALDVPVRLWPFPVSLLRHLGRALGRAEQVERLVGSLEIDPAGMPWRPSLEHRTGFERTARWYRETRRTMSR